MSNYVKTHHAAVFILALCFILYVAIKCSVALESKGITKYFTDVDKARDYLRKCEGVRYMSGQLNEDGFYEVICIREKK